MVASTHGQSEIFIPASHVPKSGVYEFSLEESDKGHFNFLYRSDRGMAQIAATPERQQAAIVVFEVGNHIEILKREDPLCWLLFTLQDGTANFVYDVYLLSILSENDDFKLSLENPNQDMYLGSVAASESQTISVGLHNINALRDWAENDTHLVVGFFPSESATNGQADLAIESCAMRIRAVQTTLPESHSVHLYPSRNINNTKTFNCQIFGVWKGANASDGSTYFLEFSEDLGSWTAIRKLYEEAATMTNFSSGGYSLGIAPNGFVRVSKRDE